MYLNIVNNLSFGNKRNKNSLSKKKEESREGEKLSKETSDAENEIWYSSIFYGELTQNWLKVTN